MNKNFSFKITTEQRDKLLNVLKSEHAMKIDVDSKGNYNLSGHGITAGAYYYTVPPGEVGENELRVSIFTHPFYLPVAAIEHAFIELIEDEPAPELSRTDAVG